MPQQHVRTGPWKRRFALAAAAACGLGVQACVSEDVGLRMASRHDAVQAVESVELTVPQYRAGDRFLYDNGRIDQVVEVDGDIVHWSTNRNYSFTAYRNPALPSLRWESAERVGQLRAADLAPEILSPSRWDGGGARFTYATVVTDKADGTQRRYDESRSCRVERAVRITVPVGTLDAVPIVCSRQGPFARYRGKRTWYYAPRVGHVVLRVYDDLGRPTRRVSLVAVERSDAGLPAAAVQGMEVLIQESLETRESDVTTEWHHTPSAAEIAVTPLRTFRAKDGAFCRDYRKDVRIGERWGSSVRRACRTRDGHWETL